MRNIVKWFKGLDVLYVVTVDHSTGQIDSRSPEWQIRPVFAWYDIWVGIFIDREKRKVYIFPLPCLGIVIYWG